jgi:GNAT superfamily N-acetyltransferase
MVRVREATTADVEAIVAIGTVGFARVHEHLLGVAATRAVIDQTYSRDAVTESVARCAAAADAHFLVAERDGRVVGYLNYDCFASEPELHRIYLAQEEIGRGTGSRLMTEHHARLGPDATYVVMVAVANGTACRFYERNGLADECRIPDGKAFYRDRMKVRFPPNAPPVPAVVMRRVGGVRLATGGTERPM